MKCDVTKKFQVKIVLNFDLEDVNWLKALVQNPSYEGESKEDASRRESLFHALDTGSNIFITKD
jgi:hypothetical protein